LKEGLVGALVTDRFFYFSDLYDRTISPTSVIFRPAGLHFAFSRQKNGNLSKIFDKHISILKNDPESLYYHSLQRWFGKRDLAGIPKYLIWLFIIIAVILSAVLLFALLLKKQVKLKTATLRRKNEELQSAKRKVEESNRLKTVFLQNISHEIRTPMNGILGFLKLLKNQGLDSENKKQYVDIINQSAQRLLETISNIVEISKIESNQVVVHSKPVNVREVMDFNLNFFKQQADKKGIHIRISTQIDEKNSFIKTDPALLNDILSNLINNAIKFTPAGEIEIGNYRKNGVLVFFVKDTGIGIPADRLDIIFDRFVQAEQKPHRAFEGSGLGLSIVKAYIQQLGGEIWVESTPGRGSTFSFSIPYLPANRTETKPKESGGSELLPRKPLIILVAEDDEISFLLLEKILKQPNITLLHAPDGQSAVRLFSEAPHISLILMDLKMPGMDGLEAARLIRKKDPQIPIIAQTAFEFSEDKERALEAGCNAVITKPINPGKLIRLIKQYAR
jgi:signal transduction histidine kinase/CheY-like chemotaxis protein